MWLGQGNEVACTQPLAEFTTNITQRKSAEPTEILSRITKEAWHDVLNILVKMVHVILCLLLPSIPEYSAQPIGCLSTSGFKLDT